MFGVLSRLSITAFFCLIWLPALLPAQDFPALRDSSQLLAVPQGLPGPTAGTAVSDDPMLVPGVPIKFSECADEPARSWPLLGEDTSGVLQTELGMSDDDVGALLKRGIVGPLPGKS